MGDGWFFKFQPASLDEINALMDEAGYKTYIESLG
jgi:glycine cleavage system H lipoate-binding protein